MSWQNDLNNNQNENNELSCENNKWFMMRY